MIGCCFQAIYVCAGSLLYVGLPLQNFHAPWREPFTLLKNTMLQNTTFLRKCEDNFNALYSNDVCRIYD